MNVRHLSEEQSFVQRLGALRERRIAYTRRVALNTAALAAGDALALAVALVTGVLLRYVLVGELIFQPWMWALLPLYAVGAAAVRLYPGWGLGAVEELRRMTLLLVGLFGVTAAVLFLMQQAEHVSRLILGVALVLSVLGVPWMRLQVKRALMAGDLWGVATVIYGAGATGRRVVETLHQEEGLGYVPAALFDDDEDLWGEYIDGVPVLGGTRLAASEAGVAVLAMPTLDRERRVALLEGPLAGYHTVVLIPDLADTPSLWVRPGDLGGVLSLEITSNLLSGPSQFVKRAFDLAAVVLSALLWAPLCALLAALIWMEDGESPFFMQERVGRNGQPFRAFKFRTMVTDAETVLQRHLDAHPEARAEWEAHYKLTHDPRVTRVGRLLRRFSLDELPQLVNVLRGEMSLVGPRPLPRYHHEELPLRVRELRERVRPGLTGLWQVSGRSDIGTAGMERWDPYYVRNWSPWLDAVVLARTFRAVVHGSGAY